MSFSLRIFVCALLLVAAALWISLANIREELAPSMRQSLEEVLVDTSNLLAVLVADELEQGTIGDGGFAASMERFAERRFNAVIYTLQKKQPSMIVYVTDADGIVVYDSRGEAVGADYSRWNDVLRTLRGEYGARSTRIREDDPSSSVMYVAAPIRQDGRLIGVLSVGKPSAVVTPFIEAARRALWLKSGGLLLLALVVSGLLSFGLTRSIRSLTRWADGVRADRRAPPPRLGEPELARLAGAMESMRAELDGKRYVENYLLALTHELKSPLAAIEGAAELLDEPMEATDRTRFVRNIRHESARLHAIVERLLRLAAIESRNELQLVERVRADRLVGELCRELEPHLDRRGVTFEPRLEPVEIDAEPHLLRQAIGSLLDNAVAFSPDGGAIAVEGSARDGWWTLTIRDDGPGVPDYAADRVFERFYSLPRPDGAPKSTGLGLPAARQVAELHGGTVALDGADGRGATATLRIPLRRAA